MKSVATGTDLRVVDLHLRRAWPMFGLAGRASSQNSLIIARENVEQNISL
jgi:hypothetical protein